MDRVFVAQDECRKTRWTVGLGSNVRSAFRGRGGQHSRRNRWMHDHLTVDGWK